MLWSSTSAISLDTLRTSEKYYHLGSVFRDSDSSDLGHGLDPRIFQSLSGESTIQR